MKMFVTPGYTPKPISGQNTSCSVVKTPASITLRAYSCAGAFEIWVDCNYGIMNSSFGKCGA